MAKLNNFINRFSFLLNCIEKPELFKIRKNGGIPDTFIKLDKP